MAAAAARCSHGTSSSFFFFWNKMFFNTQQFSKKKMKNVFLRNSFLLKNVSWIAISFHLTLETSISAHQPEVSKDDGYISAGA